MALQQLFVKYKNGIVATTATAIAIPIMNSFSSKTLASSQVINIGIQLGTQTWVAGIAGPSMFANLSENTFADVQAVLFPRYEYTNDIGKYLLIQNLTTYNYYFATLYKIWKHLWIVNIYL